MEEHREEGSSSSYGPPLKVTFSGPGKHWTDAAPSGNGRIGAMVWGGVASELVQLNEDTLWTGTPGNYTDPNAQAALLEVRKLVDSGDFAEASAAAQKLTGNPSEVYQLLGDLKLDFDDWHLSYDKETYRRELDLDTATVRLKYSAGEVEFSREYFTSFPDQVFVTRLSASKSGTLSFTVSLDSKLHHHSFVNGERQIVMEGTCPSERPPPKMNESDRPKGIQFCAVIDLQISEGKGVKSIIDEKKLKVEGADWVVLLLAASSSFDGPLTKPSDSRKDPNVDCQRALKSVRNFSYIELYARHVDDYQNLFRRVSLQLFKEIVKSENEQLFSSTAEACVKGDFDDGISTAERVRSFEHDEDPSMVELLFQFGRYLLISCSRPGSQVANLQGLWNKDIAPAWDGTPHLNINLEMNYWPSLPCNLSECQEPLFDFITSLSINGTKTAKVNYGASGWVVHHKTDVWAKSSPVDGDVVWAFWPMGGAWLCTHLWEHYKYSMDKKFLKVKAYPLFEGCASFLVDWLIDGSDGYLETNPSTSPEHEFIAPDGKLASVSYSSTMDMAIIREVFSAVEDASEILGTSDSVLVNKVKEAHKRLNPTKIARDGSIMEWAQDFGDPDVHHRHMSNLYGLYPGHTLTIERTPELCKAAENTLFKRGEEGPGWSTAWKTALWARLHNSNHAYRMIKNLFQLVDPDEGIAFKGGLYSNLFAAHPPFQIDANLGFSAAVAEMLVQSSLEDLYLLPALPVDKWGSGRVKGLMARGGITVDIQWQEGDLRQVHLRSNYNAPVILGRKLHYKGLMVPIKIEQGRVHAFDGELRQLSSL